MSNFAFTLLKKALKTPLPELGSKIIRGVKVYIKEYPSLLILQTISACNLKCEHCFINNYGKEIADGVKKIMSFEEFEKFVNQLIPAIKQAEFFQFTTFEPFLHKDIFRMMDRILEINPKIKFPILTNCQLIDDNILQNLRKYPISEFTISLDGAKKETVESFKTDASFDKIMDVAKAFNKLNFDVPLQSVFVLHKNNYLELPEYIDFVNKLGVKRIYVNNLLSFTDKHSDLTLYNGNYNNELKNVFDEAIKRVEANCQELLLPAIIPDKQGCKTCEGLFVDINGNVAPCDFLAVSTPFAFRDITYKASPVIFGNIFKSEPLDIFRSKEYKAFKKQHREGIDLPKDCEHCINAYGLMCSNRNKFGKL